MAGIDPVPLFRRLAKLPALHLALAYTASAFPVVLIRGWVLYREGPDWLNIPSRLLGLAIVSVLFTVVGLYSDDDTGDAGIFLAVITIVGTSVDIALVSILFTGSIVIAANLGFASIFLLLLVLGFLSGFFAGSVWLARKFRRYLAPDTMAPNRSAA